MGLLLGLGLTLLAGASHAESPAPPPPSASPASSASWAHLAASDQGAPETPGEKLITSDTELAAMWKQLHAHIVQGAPGLPKIDLHGESVVVVWIGQKTSGGHGVKVTGVTGPDADGTLTVQACEFAPPPDAMSTMAMTSPWVMVHVPGIARTLVVARSTCP